MGFLGALGKAFKAPLKPINKMVGKIPGMGAMANKMPGLRMGQKMGIGPSRPPTQAQGQPPMSFPQLPPMQPPQGEGDQQIQPVGMGEQGPPIGFASPDSMMGRGMNPRMGMMQKMMQMRRPMMPMRGGMGGGFGQQRQPMMQPPPFDPNQLQS